MSDDRRAEAVRVCRDDLDRFEGTACSLCGLAKSLRAQGRLDEVAPGEARFETAGAHADVTLASAAF